MTFNEYLLHNHVGRELQEILRPLIITERLIIASKYTIRDNFLTSNTCRYIVLSAIMNTVICVLHVVCLYVGYLYESSFNWSGFMSFLNLLNLVSAVLESIVNFVCGVLRSQAVAHTLLHVQSIDARLQARSLLPLCAWTRQKGIVWTLFLVCCFTQLVTASINVCTVRPISVGLMELYSAVSRFFFDINLLYVIFFVDFIWFRLEAWTVEVQQFQEAPEPCKFVNKINKPKTARMDVEGLFHIFALMTDVLELVQKVFGLSIVFYLIEVFFLCLTFVQYGIVINIYGIFEADPLAYISTAHYVCWMLKIVVLVTALSASCELCGAARRHCRRVCIATTTNTDNVHVRRLCKNIERVSGVRYVALSACGVFTLDATLPLRLGALVATYTVVLLQFALL